MQKNTDDNPELKNDLPVKEEDQAPLAEAETDETKMQFSEDQLAGLSKRQLAGKLKEYLNMDEALPVFPEARLIKNKLDELSREEYERKLKLFTRDGSPAEDFQLPADPLDETVKQLWKSLNAKKEYEQKQQENAAQENLSAKKMILEELKELLKGNENFSTSYHKFQALRSKWRNIGNVPSQDYHTLSENYFFLSGRFYDLIKINNELRELDRKKNDEYKIRLCEKAELLEKEPSLKKALNGLHILKKEWSGIKNSSAGPREELWQRFKAATHKIIERKKEHDHKLKQQQEENLAAKTKLCGQMEELNQEELLSYKVVRDATAKENTLWEAWQTIGFVPESDKGNCWKRFKKARNNFHKSLDLFYSKQRREFAANLEKKTELCLRAETLMESTDWQGTAEKLKKLQAEWKDIGPVAQKNSEAVWNRFRKACDHFFAKKADHHAERENALREIIRNREILIGKIDQFEISEDVQANLEGIKKLQEEWSASGEVSLKEAERLNYNFSRAVEKLLERMKAASKIDEKLYYRHKYAQMLQSSQGKEQVKKDRLSLLGKIKKLELEMQQLENNLGFFGKSKNAAPLLAEYQEKLEKTKLEIEELRTKLKFIPVV